MSLDTQITTVITLVRGLIKDQSLSRIPGDLYEFDNDNAFTLNENFVDETSINVFINNIPLPPSDFSYDTTNNKVTIVIISSGLSLDKGDTVLITYNYFNKYSNTELQGFINSSFAYFVENRYKKVFDINIDDEIIACNGIDPTNREIYFIAIIASILIDPMNFDIRVDGSFALTAQRNKSDREQIAEAFTRFEKFVGDIDFGHPHHNKHHKH